MLDEALYVNLPRYFISSSLKQKKEGNKHPSLHVTIYLSSTNALFAESSFKKNLITTDYQPSFKTKKDQLNIHTLKCLSKFPDK